MRITILTYVEAEGASKYDVVVEQVSAALRQHGHEPTILGVHGDVEQLYTGLRDSRPELVFNLMEMFGDSLFAEMSVAGLLDLLKVPYTGNGPGECYLQQDKALAKKLLAFDNILYPHYAVFAADASLETGGKLRMPLFVKPLRADASIGIDSRSLVRSSTDMMERVLRSIATCTIRRWPKSTSKDASSMLAFWETTNRSPFHRSRWTFPGCKRASRIFWTAKPSGTKPAPSTGGRSRKSPSFPTNRGPSCKRWPPKRIARCACAITAASICA
jgi:hypothetical protein